MAALNGQGTRKFLTEAAELLTQYVDNAANDVDAIIQLATPRDLHNRFEEVGLPLRLGDRNTAASENQLLQGLQLTLSYSARTSHPLFLNQLYGGPEAAGIIGEWLSTVANTNVHTYEVAPVFTLIELEVLAKFARLVGGAFAHAHDGLFVPGGSIANLYGLHLARNRADPDFRQRGAASGPRLVAFTSEQAHYSYLKAALLTGLGSDNLVSVPCSPSGAMDPAALEQEIARTKERGGRPFFVGSTAGTTVLGAFDPLDSIAEVCDRHGLWLHVDATWGGAALLSRKHRHLLAGCDRGDSLSWNAHKMMGLPLQCSLFLTRHVGALAAANASKAAYLFQPDKLHADLDLGDKTIQCGRRADAYKLWLAWKAFGDAGLEARMDRGMHLAEYFESALQRAGDAFVLVLPRSFANVCFWWIPPRLRPFSFAAASEEQLTNLSKVAPAVKDAMQRKGDAMIGFQPLGPWPNFFRIVFPSPFALQEHHLDALLQRMDQYGLQLFS